MPSTTPSSAPQTAPLGGSIMGGRGGPGPFTDNRDLYRMIISQLCYDEHASEAFSLSKKLQSDEPCPPSCRLSHLVALGLQAEKEMGPKNDNNNILDPIGQIDLDYESDVVISASLPADYETVYVTSHKGGCRAGAFNMDGSLVATGSVDTSIKILDVEKMILKSSGTGEDTSNPDTSTGLHPVIRTLYDHAGEVTSLQFHPRDPILFSGSDDCTIKIFDYAKPTVKRAKSTIQEVLPIKSMAMHPAGNHLNVATTHPTIRLYDVNTGSCFVGVLPADQHTKAVNEITYNQAGNMFATCSDDGDVKVWDSVSNRVIKVMDRAHDGTEVCSVQFSRNGKYLVTSGRESLVKLWELSMSRCLIAYTGAGAAGNIQNYTSRAVLSHTEDYILFPDEKSNSLCTWTSRSANRMRLLSLGHNSNIRWFGHSPNSAAFLSCSDDHRARFWVARPSAIDSVI